jgi:hypothetical protein
MCHRHATTGSSLDMIEIKRMQDIWKHVQKGFAVSSENFSACPLTGGAFTYKTCMTHEVRGGQDRRAESNTKTISRKPTACDKGTPNPQNLKYLLAFFGECSLPSM